MTTAQETDRWLAELNGPDRNAALEALYRSLRRAVFAVTYSVLCDRFLAEDAAEETFVRLISAAGRYQPRGRGRAFVLRIARYTALEAARLRKREQSTAEPPEQVAPEQDPTDRITCLAAVLQLNRKEREVVLLHYASGLPFSECAAVLSVPEGTVKYRHTGALRHLRQIMKLERQGGNRNEARLEEQGRKPDGGNDTGAANTADGRAGYACGSDPAGDGTQPDPSAAGRGGATQEENDFSGTET